ncbi:hypothetical protein F7725_000309 [Dissostichus mawsoni]|uniref:Uncharacterized protein n=1 Tax=Dissostichus mawsoni TaxID=36200 RepID=A0A7J5ZE17_DISMA|nr:hypothetical protein F7725_000309 [Dissostichus mawsoni]
MLKDSRTDDLQKEMEELTMAVFVIRKEGEGLQEPLADIGIIIEGVEFPWAVTRLFSEYLVLVLCSLHHLAPLPPSPSTLVDTQSSFFPVLPHVILSLHACLDVASHSVRPPQRRQS